MAAVESDVMKLKKHLSNGDATGVYLFFGEELYLRDIYIEKIKAVIPDDDLREFNLITIDGREADFDEIQDAVESYPMMSEKKLVIIRDTGVFKKANEETNEFYSKIISNVPDFLVLLFIEDAVDKRSSLYKAVSKSGTVCNFEYLKPYELTAWVQGYVLKAKKKMSKEIIEYFISLSQPGLINLKNELDKLISSVETEITMSDVRNSIAKSLDIQVFDLSDAIMEGNKDKALMILSGLKEAKENAFTIIYLLHSGFDKMLQSKLMLKEGMTNFDIEKKLGLPKFICKKYIDGAKAFKEDFLVERVVRTSELDLSIKQGEISDWDALYKYIFEALS